MRKNFATVDEQFISRLFDRCDTEQFCSLACVASLHCIIPASCVCMCVHVRVCVCVCVCVCVLALPPFFTSAHAHGYTRTHTHSPTHSLTHVHSHTHTHSLTHEQTNKQTNKQTNERTNERTNAVLIETKTALLKGSPHVYRVLWCCAFQVFVACVFAPPTLPLPSPIRTLLQHSLYTFR